MISEKHTIVIRHNNKYFKIFKIIFGKQDGSIYITSPYHPSSKAFVLLSEINYSKKEQFIKYQEEIKVAYVNDDTKRLKLSHHQDGFIQISGHGIISGKDTHGNIKGIGVNSWPLANPVAGPAFAITVHGFEHFDQISNINKGYHVFNIDSFPYREGEHALIFQCYCFPKIISKNIVSKDYGEEVIEYIQPSVLPRPLRVAAPLKSSSSQSFIGIDLNIEKAMEEQCIPSFFLSSSSGNIRYNEKGEMLGDSIFCIYPLPDSQQNIRTLNYFNPTA